MGTKRALRQNHHFVFPLVPSLVTVFVFLVLISLGGWQLARLQWKESLLEEIHKNIKLPPVSIDTLLNDMDLSKWHYRKVHLQGTFLNDLETRLIPKTYDGQPGYHLITPFRLQSGEVVLVNRGWISTHAPYESIARNDGVVDLVGVFSPLEPKGYFTPKNNFEKREIFNIDIHEFAEFTNLVTLLPIYIILEPQTEDHKSFPRPVGISLNIPNNHLAYALTWFGLALALLVIYGIFVYQWNHRLQKLHEHNHSV